MTDIKPVARQWIAVTAGGRQSEWMNEANQKVGSLFELMLTEGGCRVEYRNLYAEEDVQKLRDEIDRLKAQYEQLWEEVGKIGGLPFEDEDA